jgi:hypothetical protein
MITQILSVLIMALTAVGVIGCAEGSGIVEIADGTYMYSKLGGAFTVSGGAVKAELYKEANESCAANVRRRVQFFHLYENQVVATKASPLCPRNTASAWIPV